jgi:hypothetical protein
MKYWNKKDSFARAFYWSQSYRFTILPRSKNFNPLTLELNPSAQRCISLIYVWKANKYTNYSFSLLIMYGSSYMFWYYIAIFRERF